MKKLLIIFFSIFLIGFCEESIKQITDTDLKFITEKIEKLEKRLNSLEKEVKSIDDSMKEIRKTLRNLQIYSRYPEETIRPSEEHWKLIKKGMEKKEVENILGLPDVQQKGARDIETWVYYRLGRIYFNPDGRVINIETNKNLSPEEIFR